MSGLIPPDPAVSCLIPPEAYGSPEFRVFGFEVS